MIDLIKILRQGITLVTFENNFRQFVTDTDIGDFVN